MDNLKENKKIIIICLFIILVVIGITYLNKQMKINNSESILDNRFVEITHYNANEYIPVYMTEEDVMKKYLNDFKNLMINDTEEAYYLLNEIYRNMKFKDINEFIEYVNDLKSLSLYNLSVDKYNVKVVNGKKFFDIYGTDGNRYIIKEISIMNYEVYLDNYTVEIK